MLEIIFLITFLYALVLGIFVYTKNSRSKINKYFAITSILFSFWILDNFFMGLTNSHFLARNVYALGSLLFPSVLIFTSEFCGNSVSKIREVIYWAIGLLFFILSFTRLFIKEIISVKFGTFEGTYGIIFYFWAAYMTLFIIYSVFVFVKYYRISQGLKRLQIKYVATGFISTGIFGILVDVILPLLGNKKWMAIDSTAALFYLSFTAYAIVAQQLFGIRVILTQALVGVIAILLLAQSIAAIPSWIEFSWKFALFLLFLVFGYFLIQSVIREIQRRAELQKLYGEVDRLSRAKSEFISIVSHQLRTPLTAIRSYIYMILKGRYGKVEEKEEKPLEKISQSAERLLTLVNDLLDLSRIESGTIKLELKKTSLLDIISSIVDELIIKANEKNIYLKMENEGSEPLPEVMVDPGKIRQVIMNIVDNCIKYTGSGGVTVRTKLVESSTGDGQRSIMIVVKDTGEGMTKEDTEHLFQGFARGAAGEKNWAGGVGLGLYIARKFTELHGGKVWAESEGEGKGSTFYIELPVKNSPTVT